MNVVKKIATISVLLLSGLTIHYLISFGRGISDLALLPVISLVFIYAGFILKVFQQKLIPNIIVFLAAAIGLFGLGYMENTDPSVIPLLKEVTVALLSFFIGHSFSPARLNYFFMRLAGYGLVLGFFLLFINPLFLYRTQFSYKENKDLQGSLLQYSLKDSAGSTISPGSLKGRVVLLDFWFIGCRPCYSKLKELEKLASGYATNKDVVFLIVNSGVRDSYSDFLAEIKKFPKGLLYAYDSAAAFSQALKINAYPTEILIDKKGHVKDQFLGYNDDVAMVYTKETIKKINLLLSEK